MFAPSHKLQAIETDLRIALKHLWSNHEQLSEEKLHKKAVLDSIDDGIAVVNNGDVVAYANRQFKKFFPHAQKWEGASLSELFSLFNQISDRKDWIEFQKVYHRVHAGNHQYSATCEIDLNPQAGSLKAVRIFTGPIFNKNQKLIGRVWKFEDTTKEKELEQMKSEFVSLASHQLRTPVTAIHGYLQMIVDGNYGALPDQIATPIETILRSASQMRDLINDLLDVSRLDSAKVKPQFELVDIIPVVQAEIIAQSSISEAKQIQVHFFPRENSLMAVTDPRMVREMFKNYLNNALKYTPDFHSVWVDIKSEDNWVSVHVRDEGMGIPLDQQDQLFQKFFRASNVASSSVDGTGLGLYYVQKCAESLEAKLGFRSQENIGSEFWFAVPQKRDQTELIDTFISSDIAFYHKLA